MATVTTGQSTYSWVRKTHAFLLTLFVVFILIFGMAFAVAYHHHKDAVQHIINSNRSTAESLRNIILERQKGAIGILESYVSRRSLLKAVEKRDYYGALEHLFDLKQGNAEVEDVFITDQDGTLLANVPINKESHGTNLSYRDWYQGVRKEWKPYISGVYKRMVGEKDLAVAVCVPILDETGKVVGILGNTQITPSFGPVIDQVTLNPDTKISLIDQVGNVIYSNKIGYGKELDT